MPSLYKTANRRQRRLLRIVEGAVKNTYDAHPEIPRPDWRFARSLAKRAVGTITAQWAGVLALPLVPATSDRATPQSYDGGRLPLISGLQRPGLTTRGRGAGGSKSVMARPPRILKFLHGAIGALAGEAKRAKKTERYEALVDVLKLIGRMRNE